MKQYEEWQALVKERAPNKDDVVELTMTERDELAKLRGTRRLPPLLFGRKVVKKEEGGTNAPVH